MYCSPSSRHCECDGIAGVPQRLDLPTEAHALAELGGHRLGQGVVAFLEPRGHPVRRGSAGTQLGAREPRGRDVGELHRVRPLEPLAKRASCEGLERCAREGVRRRGVRRVRAERVDRRGEDPLGLEQERGQHLSAGSDLARGERESLWNDPQAVLGGTTAEMHVSGLDELSAALEARAVGHHAGPHASADAGARLEHRHVDSGACQVDGAGEAGQARAHDRDLHCYAAERSRLSRTSSSAISTAFVAAPLRRLSATTHNASAFASPRSRRMRPTSTPSVPSASTAVG